jgi:transcription initiation factor TFIIB
MSCDSDWDHIWLGLCPSPTSRAHQTQSPGLSVPNPPSGLPTVSSQCPYCRASGPARCVTTQPPLSRAVSECSACARIVLERHLHTHPFFPLLPSLHPLPLVTPDLATAIDPAPSPSPGDEDDEDPFLPAGFVSAFSAFSLERHPVLARSASTFSGHLAELERALAVDSATAASNPDPAGPMVSIDSLRAYLQIVDVASNAGEGLCGKGGKVRGGNKMRETKGRHLWNDDREAIAMDLVCLSAVLARVAQPPPLKP